MRRYWSGKLPVWAVTGEQTTDEDDKEEEQQTTRKHKFVGGDDSRLCRLAKARADEKKKKYNDVRSFHRAEILSTTPEVQCIVDDDDDGEVDDEDVLEEKRHKLKEKILRLQRQQEEKEKEQVSSLFQEEEDESEYETTDSEVDDSDLAMLPVYVPKLEWDTIADRERIEAKVHALQSMMENRAEERKCETKRILLSLIQQEEDTTCHHSNDSFDIDDDFNGKDEEQEEHEAWKIRETLRMRRDKVAATLDRDKEEHMDELSKEKLMSPSLGRINNSNPLHRQSKQKWRFMQKYYHKGAFFQSYADDPYVAAGTDDIYARDFSAPTGDDKMDRTLLPKVMQVKHFGRIGRTKWTHLLNEDTTYN